MSSMSKALAGLSVIISMLVFICVGPVLAQRPGQDTLGDGAEKWASSDQTFEQAMKELKSLNDQVREARQQQADERAAAAREIATLEAENKQLKTARDQNELRLLEFEARERTVKGIQGKPPWQETCEMLEKLLKEVTELRQILDRSLPWKTNQFPPADERQERRTNDNESRSKP